MRRVVLALLLSLAGAGLAQAEPGDAAGTAAVLAWLREHARPLAGVDAGAPRDDLAALGDLVGDARVVALGEQTHGTSEFFRMKHRALEHLVLEHGFTLFAIEANMPEAERLNRYVLSGEGDAQDLLAGLHSWTWHTEEVLALIAWMRDHNEAAEVPVRFTGFDMQYPDVAVENVRAFLADHDPELLAAYEADLTAAAATSRLRGSSEAPSPELRERVDELVAAMTAREAGYAAAAGEDAAAWAVQDGRVVAQSLGLASGGTRWRDEAMARNLLWLLDRYPGERMLVWAHNGHVSKAAGWMGSHLAAALGDAYVCVAFSFEQGAYTAYDPEFGGVGASVAGPAPAGTVDRLLAEVGPDVFLLDLRDAAGSAVEPWFLAPRRFRAVGAVAVHDAGSFAPATLGEEFDGVIFVRRSTPSRRLPRAGRVGSAAGAWALPPAPSPEPAGRAARTRGRRPDVLDS